VELNSRSYNSAYSLSYANLATGKYEAAVEAATKALVLDKNSSPALFVLGVSQRRLRLFEDAERSLLRVQAIDRGATPEIGWNLALLYAHNLKRHDAAADQLDLILRSNPDVPNAEVIKKLIKQFRESSMASK
jgi:tetratricopeptide (TPR) repeat protein